MYSTWLLNNMVFFVFCSKRALSFGNSPQAALIAFGNIPHRFSQKIPRPSEFLKNADSPGLAETTLRSKWAFWEGRSHEHCFLIQQTQKRHLDISGQQTQTLEETRGFLRFLFIFQGVKQTLKHQDDRSAGAWHESKK